MTLLQNIKFPWLKIKFPDFSLTLNFFIQTIFITTFALRAKRAHLESLWCLHCVLHVTVEQNIQKRIEVNRNGLIKKKMIEHTEKKHFSLKVIVTLEIPFKNQSIFSWAIPIKCFVSHRPTDPFFFGKVKKKFRITCKEAITLVYKHTILSYNTNLSIIDTSVL